MKSLKYFIYLILLLMVFTFILPAGADEPPTFKIIVHTSNPVTALTKGQVYKFYIRKETKWENGGKVIPIDQTESSDVRKDFTKRVFDKSVQAMKNYWQQMIFSGRSLPPIELPSDNKILEYIASHQNAIGYVSSDTPLRDDIKVVEVIY